MLANGDKISKSGKWSNLPITTADSQFKIDPHMLPLRGLRCGTWVSMTPNPWFWELLKDVHAPYCIKAAAHI